jgi:hypothetical protein
VSPAKQPVSPTVTMSSHRVFEMVDNTTKNVLRVSMNISNRYRLVAVPFKADVYVHLTDTFKNSTVSMPLEGFENMVQDIKDFIPRCRFLAVSLLYYVFINYQCCYLLSAQSNL